MIWKEILANPLMNVLWNYLVPIPPPMVSFCSVLIRYCYECPALKRSPCSCVAPIPTPDKENIIIAIPLDDKKDPESDDDANSAGAIALLPSLCFAYLAAVLL